MSPAQGEFFRSLLEWWLCVAPGPRRKNPQTIGTTWGECPPAKANEASLLVRCFVDRLVDLFASFFDGPLRIEFILRRLDRLVDLLTSLLDRPFVLTPNGTWHTV